MKCRYPLPTILFILCVVLSLLSCAGAPGKAEEEDVWTALEKGETEKARSFFLGKVDVRATDAGGRTPLHIAAERGDAQLGAFFVSLGAEVDALDNEGRSPLGISAKQGDAEMARILVRAGAGIHQPMPGIGSAALEGISRRGEFLDALLSAQSLESRDAEGRNILHLAALAGEPEAAARILEFWTKLPNPDIMTPDHGGKTALDLAFSRPESRNHAEIAEMLILAGGRSGNAIYPYFAAAARTSNYNIRFYDGGTPLHFAARENYLGLIRFFIERMAEIDIKDASGATPLYEAARYGNLGALELLLSLGADPNVQDAKGNSVLHIAVPPEVHREVIGLLLAYQANPNLRDEHGDSPLHILIMLNREEGVLQSLLSGGAEVSTRNIDGKTPLYLAVEESRTGLIPLLLSYQSDVFAADNGGITPIAKALETQGPVLQALITPETVQQTDSAGNTILHTAIQKAADLRTITLILEQRALVDARNREGDTSFHLAVRMNRRETGELLMSRGADVFAPNARGETPLYLAFHAPDGARLWIINNHTIAARDGLGNGILHYAAQWKLDNHIPYLVQQGANVEAVNATGETPLFVGVKYNGASTIDTLVNAGASINTRDKLGNSALHAAVRWNNEEAARALIEGGIDVDSHALNGKTPLHDAVRLGITGLEALLVEKGADIEIRDAEGNTPFMEAVTAGYSPAAERLVDMGADPNTRNNQGDTPLHLAVSSGRTELVNMLLSWGAPIHARNSRGLTPFRIALTQSPRMVSTLLTKDRIQMADDDGASPLHIAVREGADPASVQVIIAQGGRLSPADSSGRSPLRLAVDADSWELAKILADAGADPFTMAGDGKTPGEIAIAKGPEAVQAVFSGGAINARDPSGNTILHYAARSGNAEIVAQLLRLGASKSIRNISAESPADIAKRWNRNEALAMLN
jgi:ankyrin repeat protein